MVDHVPPAGYGPSLGSGIVFGSRKLAGYFQVLVQFAETGESRWIDWRLLSVRKGLPVTIVAGESTSEGAEKVRLKVLAKALEIWNANTGALGRLDIDPLPHQIDVARRVVTSAQPRWLIADDVGLGKTVEVGLILHALTQRNQCRRVLVVCPSPLTRQWKEEMRTKFGRRFEICGRDFHPEGTEDLRARDNVIVSVDYAKRIERIALFATSEKWDVIIFDEAHRLGRSESGERTERYALAEALKTRTNHSLLLLTATPHQGKSRRFQALLELVRPDLKRQIRTLEMNPEIVEDIIIRNRKTEVSDAEGRLIFRGHDTRRHMVTPTSAMMDADRALQAYLREGYRAGSNAQNEAIGRAIGFVMTTYRKLASSSVAAIEAALERRLDRILSKDPVSLGALEDEDGNDDLAENTALDGASFFEDEPAHVRSVLEFVRRARRDDAKLATFRDDVMRPLLKEGRSLLIFTEYRATQLYLENTIRDTFPEISVGQINGSMSLDDKMENVRAFNRGEAQVMISTEAGGEGLNLQKTCHVMVNYDLPWNPSRLVQRIGRLYRYGQTRRVQVVNLQANDGFDNQALGLMLDRVETMAREMASVDARDRDAMASDILGELMANIDMSEILERATEMRLEQTEAEIAAALEQAQRARAAEQDILKFASSQQAHIGGGFDSRHILSLVEGMARFADYTVRRWRHDGKTVEIELGDSLYDIFPEFGRRRVIPLTTDSERALNDPTLVHIDLEQPFLRRLIDMTRDREVFDTDFAVTKGEKGLMLISQLRWQDFSGTLLEEELLAVEMRGSSSAEEMIHNRLAGLLRSSLSTEDTCIPATDREARRQLVKEALQHGQILLQRKSGKGRMPGTFLPFAALEWKN
ncbi:DEAD/DEAH box helicase [Phaeobacter inhibens]|uniref:DEAD/DEAH box helicase n=1 Tax=Phaeobacter inhibens TaxID=221822 RepID=UPI0021A668E3|nr:DEAD/DEAH box helicase [Phaeobacter inhibens]UWR84925.1 DEAD/DEAH box helicase [Phaeobacter inhibens]